MNISQLARTVGISTDTVRYYEKQGILSAPERQDNGYRLYAALHVELLRFVRGAQALGFTLAEIRDILPQLEEGKLGRIDIEIALQSKMTQIDAHIRQLKALKKELANTFASLSCASNQPVGTASAIAPDSGSGAGVAVVRRAFADKKPAARTG